MGEKHYCSTCRFQKKGKYDGKFCLLYNIQVSDLDGCNYWSLRKCGNCINYLNHGCSITFKDVTSESLPCDEWDSVKFCDSMKSTHHDNIKRCYTCKNWKNDNSFSFLDDRACKRLLFNHGVCSKSDKIHHSMGSCDWWGLNLDYIQCEGCRYNMYSEWDKLKRELKSNRLEDYV